MGFEAAVRSGSEAYLAKDHQMRERLFCMIISGLYAGTTEESKEKFLLRVRRAGIEPAPFRHPTLNCCTMLVNCMARSLRF